MGHLQSRRFGAGEEVRCKLSPATHVRGFFFVQFLAVPGGGSYLVSDLRHAIYNG